jgi:OmpA-OmpF porin, OOP family
MLRVLCAAIAVWSVSSSAFGQAPPPPPPPAACSSVEAQIFFEWDRSNLNAFAVEAIDAIADRARQCRVSRVSIVGGMDTTGTDAYTLELARRQGQNVKDALVARGFPEHLIEMESRGSEFLPTQTQDGVREPLNRATLILVEFH